MKKPFFLTLIKLLFGIALLALGFFGSAASLSFDALNSSFRSESKVFNAFFMIAALTPLFILLPEKKDLPIRLITVGFALLFFFKLPFIAFSGCLFVAGGIFLLSKTSS